VLLGLWVATALLYPTLLRGVTWFVDTVLLRRADYGDLRTSIGRKLAEYETTRAALDAVCVQLAPALSSQNVSWREVEAADLTNESSLVALERNPEQSVLVLVPTAEAPNYSLAMGPLSGGRRLLSDDIALLESVALMTARRIDAIRVSHERFEQDLREQEIGKLATEAQLRALRSQINPHFLFNALTTIGYLIKASPDRALSTLLRLTELLRGVLREGGEVVTLGDELDLIGSYLEIERARFEERLGVEVDVPDALRTIRLPSFLVQPLVENAIKHGIARRKAGGAVSISAWLATQNGRPMLHISVRDTGAGATEMEVARGRQRGVGLNNLEQRLQSYCGGEASFSLETEPGVGATATLRFPLSPSGQVAINVAGTGRRRA
jgi:signal transduction histidine kinase